ncbi:MAG TPA: PQQ-binding-like beta-propeller repeat protein, partial [Micavibrio sp.]
GHLEEPPRVDEARHQLWIGAGPGSLWSLDTRDGSVLWHQDLGHLDATPLVHDDVLYVPAQKSETLNESFFYALNAKNGEILWKLDQPGQPWGSPILHKNGKIVLTTTGIGQIGVQRDTDKGWAYGVSLEGKILWQTQLPDMAVSSDIYLPDQDIIIYVAKNGSVIALNASDGSRIWETKAGVSFYAPGVLVTRFRETLLAVMATDGVFSLINAHTGEIAFTYKRGERSRAAPLVHGDIIYIATDFGIAAIGEKQ